MIPTSAMEAITRLASEHRLFPHEIMAAGLNRRDIAVVRREAIQALSNEQVGGRYRYAVGDIAEWFGISRARVNMLRSSHPGYVARPRGLR